MAKNNQELLAKVNGRASGADKPRTVVQSVRDAIEAMKDQIAIALPKHLTPDRFARIIMTTIRSNPKLLECSIESLMGAAMQSAQLGLDPSIPGHAYFVPFRKKIKGKNGEPDRWIMEVQFIAGYKGLLDLIRRSGQILTIQAQCVFSNDVFEFEYGWESKLRHVPNFQNRGKFVGVYCYGITKDGGQYFEFMTLADVNAVREKSKAKDDGPWSIPFSNDWLQMARKTAIRRISNYLPMSIEIAERLAKIDAEEEAKNAAAIEINLGDDGDSNSKPRSDAEIDAAFKTIPDPLPDTDSDLVFELAAETEPV